MVFTVRGHYSIIQHATKDTGHSVCVCVCVKFGFAPTWISSWSRHTDFVANSTVGVPVALGRRVHQHRWVRTRTTSIHLYYLF